ncbi:MAG: ATP-binding protein [Chloroflexota bacterium]|nr:ATP-binding protein [Chloroflexota bacterium]MDQ5866803.1 ATP-binding protein [Chloroflexota bacterium]
MHGSLQLQIDAPEQVSERQDMALQLARLQEQAQLLDLIHDAVILRDMEDAIIFWNRGAEELYGWSQTEALGRVSFALLQTQFPQPLADITAELLNNGRWEGELVQTGRDGGHIVISSRWTLLRGTQGEPLATFQINTDITERKLMEEKLQAFTIQLQRSNRELEEFATVASHDLQEPLRKIQAFGNRLSVKYGDSLDDDGRDYLNRMLTSAARMRILVDDLLDYSRLTIKSRHYVKVDLGALCRDVLSDLGQQIEQSRGRVEVGDLPTIEADEMQMSRLLQNLISNALKFSPEGVRPSIKVSARLAEGSADPCLSDLAATEHWEIRVQDQGIGFDAKYLDRIFAPFQRLHGRNEFEGTGIGLAICRKIAESHWGSITAESAVGKGATFIVTLPAAQPPIARPIVLPQEGESY